MPIADIQAEVQGNPSLLNEIATAFGKDIIPIIGQNDELVNSIVPVLGTRGFVVRSKADNDSFLNSFKNQIIETEMSPRVKEIYDKLDADITELTGLQKQPHEKTYDFNKRVLQHLKTSQVSDPVVKQQIETLQSQLVAKENDYKKQIEDIQNKHFSEKLSSLITSALDKVNIALPSNLKTDEEKQKYINSQKLMMKKDMLSELVAKKDSEGNVVFYEGDKPLTSTADGKALQAIDIITSRYSHYIAPSEQQPQGGAGSGKGGNGGQVFANKDQVIAHLESRGLKQGRNDFLLEYEKECKASGLL